MCLTTDFTPHGSTLLHHAARCEARIDVQEMKSLQHAPSKVAAAAVGLALRINHLPPWSAALRKYSRYTEESLAPVQQVCLYAHTHRCGDAGLACRSRVVACVECVAGGPVPTSRATLDVRPSRSWGDGRSQRCIRARVREGVGAHCVRARWAQHGLQRLSLGRSCWTARSAPPRRHSRRSTANSPPQSTSRFGLRVEYGLRG
jgi:hypothetical protein